jgi:hypothetical protein
MVQRQSLSFFLNLYGRKFGGHRDLEHFEILGMFGVSLHHLPGIGDAVAGLQNDFAEAVIVSAHPAAQHHRQMEPNGVIVHGSVIARLLCVQRTRNASTKLSVGRFLNGCRSAGVERENDGPTSAGVYGGGAGRAR